MKKLLYAALISTLILACSSDRKSGNMKVTGQIKDLKKATLYLQKMQDTILISVDSVTLKGNDTFTLSDNVESPEMYYLTFDGNTTEKRIMFFGEQGTITINDKLEDFGIAPKIEGSANQKVYDEFKKIDRKFVDQRLDFIQKDFEARSNKDEKLVKKLEEDYKKMMRKRFLFTTQFAKNNGNSEAAPYIALSELFDANIILLDTINASLTDKVRTSKYGKQLQKFITDVKEKEGK